MTKKNPLLPLNVEKILELFSPLIYIICFEGINAVDVRDVEDWLITGWIWRHLYQDFVQEQRLTENRLQNRHPHILLKRESLQL